MLNISGSWLHFISKLILFNFIFFWDIHTFPAEETISRDPFPNILANGTVLPYTHFFILFFRPGSERLILLFRCFVGSF